MTLSVVDVSSHQTKEQANDSRAQATIIKATQGTSYVNPLCNSQWDSAKKGGKLLGLYHYAGGGSATAEADYFIKNIKNYVHQAILVLDWESYQNSAYGNGKWANEFVDRVHALTGVYPLLYTGSEGAGQCATYLKSKSGLWLAGYPYKSYPSFTPPAQTVFNSLYNTHGMNLVGWQYSSTGIDHSIFYMDSQTWGKYANPTGSTAKVKPEPKPVAKPKYNLAVDGSLGPATIKAMQQIYGMKIVDGKISHPSNLVKKIQSRVGVPQDGSMGPQTIRAMQRRAGTIVDGRISRPSLLVKYIQKKINSGVTPF